MRKNILLLLCVFSVLLSRGQDAKMSTAEIAVFKEQVKTASNTTQTILSDFVQYKHLDFLDNDIETFGKMAFKAPGLVKWEYTKPYQYSVIFKEDVLLINDGGTKSNVDIGSSKLFKKLNELIVNSVQGNMFDDNDFEISYLKTADSNKAIFLPKDKKIKDFIASFELLFDTKDAAVLQVKMIEPSGDFTRILFSNRRLNATIDTAVFTH